MSRIEELIRELCPDGVEYRPLGEVAVLVRGNGMPKKDLVPKGVGAIHYGQIYTHYGAWADSTISFVTPATAEKLVKVDPGDVIITNTSENIDDVGKAVAWLGRSQIVTGGHATVIKHSQDPKFLSYWFQSPCFSKQKTNLATGTKVVDVSAKSLSRIEMPIPPLEVQREIVRILDTLTELETELQAEWEARKQQYDHYRRVILTSDSHWRTFRLGEVARVFDGPHATPKKTTSGPWYLSISSLKNGNTDLADSAHLKADDYSKWTNRVSPRRGDTLFSYETRIGQAGYWDLAEQAALGRRMGLLRPNRSVVLPRFLTMVYLGPQFQRTIASRTVRGSTVDRIPIARMVDWPIELPAISEQQRIVSLLDEFDSLVNDLTSGLPAEIEARRHQYEYYRDQLLTFKEKA